MATLDHSLGLANTRTPASAQELKEEVQKEAMRRFYETLEILTEQDTHSSNTIAFAKELNRALMPLEFWLQAQEYHSEAGIARLAQMKQLLDADKED